MFCISQYPSRPPEAPIYLCLENSRFEASKIENHCPEIADLRPEKSDLCPEIADFRGPGPKNLRAKLAGKLV